MNAAFSVNSRRRGEYRRVVLAESGAAGLIPRSSDNVANMRGGMIKSSGVLRAVGVIALALGLALPARAGSPARLDLEYHLYGLGIHAMTIQLRYKRGDDSYRARLGVLTDGVVETFYDYSLRANAKGSRDGDALRPSRYTAISHGSDGAKRVEVSYTEEGGIDIDTDEKLKAAERAARIERGHGTVDPLSALLTLIETLAATGSCDAKVEVFDGKRRYDMTAADGATDGGAIAAPTAADGEIECRVALKQIAGFREREKDSPRYPRTMTIRFGRVAKGFPLMPVEVNANNFFGLVSLRLISAKATPAS
jgi:hypothetical protein